MKKLRLVDLCMIALFAALMCTTATIKIPLPNYMPITIQTLFALLSGAVLGRVRGAIAMLVYLAVGLVGLPVFATGGGLNYVFTPYFGFLLGFVLAAYLTGFLFERVKKDAEWKSALIFILGAISVYIIGLPYMYFMLLNTKKAYHSLSALLAGGLVPYIIGDLLKVFICVVVVAPLRRAYKKI